MDDIWECLYKSPEGEGDLGVSLKSLSIPKCSLGVIAVGLGIQWKLEEGTAPKGGEGPRIFWDEKGGVRKWWGDCRLEERELVNKGDVRCEWWWGGGGGRRLWWGEWDGVNGVGGQDRWCGIWGGVLQYNAAAAAAAAAWWYKGPR